MSQPSFRLAAWAAGGVLLGGAGLSGLYWVGQDTTAAPAGRAAAEPQLASAPSRITRYDYYDLGAASQAHEGSPAGQREQLAHVDPD